MRRQTLPVVATIMIAIVMMNFQCNRDVIDVKPKYEFLEKLNLTPYKKVYSINDTITIQFQTSDKRLFDRLSNSMITNDTSQLIVSFNYHRRYPIGSQPEFFCDMKADNPIELVFQPQYSWYNVLAYKTDCSSRNYYFKTSFIPKKTGIYSIEPRVSHQYCQNKIDRPYTQTKFVFDLSDCNKDIWLSVPTASRGGDTQTAGWIDNKELFMFKVE